MKKIYITLLIIGACAVSQMGCDDEVVQVCDGNCDADYAVEWQVQKDVKDGNPAVVMTIKHIGDLKYPTYFDGGDDDEGVSFKSHYRKYQPVIDFAGHQTESFDDSLCYQSIFFIDINAPLKETAKYNITDSGTAVYYYIVSQIASPTNRYAGRIQATFWHNELKSSKDVKEKVFYFDVSQNPPVQVTKTEYYDLAWVKAL